jgi:hypothetical protein
VPFGHRDRKDGEQHGRAYEVQIDEPVKARRPFVVFDDDVTGVIFFGVITIVVALVTTDGTADLLEVRRLGGLGRRQRPPKPPEALAYAGPLVLIDDPDLGAHVGPLEVRGFGTGQEEELDEEVMVWVVVFVVDNVDLNLLDGVARLELQDLDLVLGFERVVAAVERRRIAFAKPDGQGVAKVPPPLHWHEDLAVLLDALVERLRKAHLVDGRAAVEGRRARL